MTRTCQSIVVMVRKLIDWETIVQDLKSLQRGGLDGRCVVVHFAVIRVGRTGSIVSGFRTGSHVYMRFSLNCVCKTDGRLLFRQQCDRFISEVSLRYITNVFDKIQKWRFDLTRLTRISFTVRRGHSASRLSRPSGFSRWPTFCPCQLVLSS